MKSFAYTNCTLLNDGIFVIGKIGGFPAKLSFDGEFDYYDRMDGFIVNNTVTIIDCMDNFQNRVYALDSKEDNLVIFDLKKCECRYIPLGCNHSSWMNFVALERYQSNYYIFPKYDNRLLIYDTRSDQIREIKNYLSGSGEVQCVCRVKDNVWVLRGETGIIYCYHLPTGENKVYELKRKIENCVHAFFNGIYIFFLNKYGVVYRWDINRAELHEITVSETKHSEEESMSRIIYAGNKLILLPALGRDIKILDLQDEKIKIYHDYPKDFFFEPDKYKFYGYCEDERYYIFSQCFGNYYLKINKQSGQFVWVKPIIDQLGKKTIERLEKKVVYEGSLEITDLLKVHFPKMYWCESSLIGGKIFSLVKS